MKPDRIRRLIPTAPDDLIARLAANPDAEAIVRGLRQARKDERAHLEAQRRQRRADARKHRHMDESDYARRDAGLIRAAGRRAAANPEALATLAATRRQIDEAITAAAVQLHAAGLTDGEIAVQLGQTKQAVQNRRRRAESHGAPPEPQAHPPTAATPSEAVRGQIDLSRAVWGVAA